MKIEKLARDLAEAVMEWEKIDDEVAVEGWDGGGRDAEWDSCKGSMISIAGDILDGKSNDDSDDAELKIVHDKEKGAVVGIGLKVRPASGDRQGGIDLRMIHSGDGDVKKEALLPIRLGFLELCSVLSVLDGLETRVEISQKAPVVPITRELSIWNNFYGRGYGFSLSTEAYGADGALAWTQKLEFSINAEEALGLREVIRHAMLLVGCGRPSEMKGA